MSFLLFESGEARVPGTFILIGRRYLGFTITLLLSALEFSVTSSYCIITDVIFASSGLIVHIVLWIFNLYTDCLSVQTNTHMNVWVE